MLINHVLFKQYSIKSAFFCGHKHSISKIDDITSFRFNKQTMAEAHKVNRFLLNLKYGTLAPKESAHKMNTQFSRTQTANLDHIQWFTSPRFFFLLRPFLGAKFSTKLSTNTRHFQNRKLQRFTPSVLFTLSTEAQENVGFALVAVTVSSWLNRFTAKNICLKQSNCLISFSAIVVFVDGV